MATLPAGTDPGLRIHDRHFDVVAPSVEIGDGVELARERVALGVRRVPALQCPVEVAGTYGFQVAAQFVRAGTCLHDGEGAPGMADDIGVGCEVHPGVHRPRPGLLAECQRHLRRTHPAVPIPLGPTLTQTDPVHHAVAGEPVIGGGLGGGDRIRPVPQVAAAQDVGHVPGHLEIGRSDLFEHRGIIALQVRIGGDGHGFPLRLRRPRERTIAAASTLGPSGAPRGMKPGMNNR